MTDICYRCAKELQLLFDKYTKELEQIPEWDSFKKERLEGKLMALEDLKQMREIFSKEL